MPLLERGPLAGFYLPDYGGGSILNLLGSVIRALGGRSPHPPLDGLPPEALDPAERIVCAIVDGLGVEQLARHAEEGRGKGFLARTPHRTISTVFPATTAAAITTFTTGASPAEHGILGWHLHLADLGLVCTILPATTRLGVPLAPAEFSLRDYLAIPSHVESVRCRTHLLSYGTIPQSRFSRAGTRWTESASFTTLKGLERQVTAFARGRGPALALAYWPSYDTLCHELGTRDPKTRRHLGDVDAMLARLADALAGTRTTLIVTSDHGLDDAVLARQVELRDVPRLYDTLAALPSGDARGVHCFVRPSRVREFLAIVEEKLSHLCVCVRGEELLGRGVFGPGTHHPALASRVGDHALLARAGVAFAATPRGVKTHLKRGNHGGMSATEVLVPLYAMRAGTSILEEGGSCAAAS